MWKIVKRFLVSFLLLFIFISQAMNVSKKQKDSCERIDLDEVISFSRRYGMTESLEKVEALRGNIMFKYVPKRFVFSRKIVAFSEGDIEAGCVKMTDYEISRLVVEPKFCRRGIARALMLAAFFKLVSLSKRDAFTISWLPVTSGVISQGELEKFYGSFYGVSRSIDSWGIMYMRRDFC